MRQRLAILVAMLVALTGTTFIELGSPAHADPSARLDKDCADFPSQAAAQHYFDDHGGSPSNNFDLLDADHDGIACESNPCPCTGPSGGGGGGGGTPGGGGPSHPQVKKDKAIIIRVIDGDTVDARLIGGPKVRVRLLGIDTPELHPLQCGAQPAKKLTKNLLPKGTHVLLTSDPTQSLKDRYGRLLRYINKGSKDIDLTIVRRGFAKVFVVGKPFQRVSKYRSAQADARRHDRGNWATCF